MAQFKEAKGFAAKSFGIERYLENEPGKVIDMEEEMLKSKDQREEEEVARKKDHASFRSMCAGLASSQGFGWKRWRIAVFTEGNNFKLVFITLVCINGVLIGVQADHGENVEFWQIVEFCFLVAFVVELGSKLAGFGYLFFTDGWNIFDFSIVAFSVAELVLAMGMGQSSSGLSSFRLLRIFRIVRVIGFVARLNLLVQAFLVAMKSVVWVGVLVVMAVYIFAIMAQGFFKNLKPELFGTVPRSMAALFQMLTMDSWASGIAWPIGEEQPFAWAFFITFILLGAFGLLNLLTGVFIEALMEITRRNDIDAQEALQRQRRGLIQIVAGAFKQTDEDGGGSLDQDELPQMLQLCDDYKEMLEYVGLSYEKMERACRIADYAHEGRTYWETTDEEGNAMVAVHHVRHRPPPEKGTPGYTKLAGGEEGVMEGEIVECLTNMDEGTTVADFYEIMKTLRLLEDGINAKLEEMDWRLRTGLKELMRLCGGDENWEAPPMPEKEWVEEEEEEEEGEVKSVALEPIFKAPEEAQAQSQPEESGAGVPSMGAAEIPVGSSPSNPVTSDERDTAALLFERYDLDNSGTINSMAEMKQLVTNMMYTTGLDQDLTKKVHDKLSQLPPDVCLNLEQFIAWYDDAKSS